MKRILQNSLSSALILGMVIGSGFSAFASPAYAATETLTGTQDQPINAQAQAYRQGVDQGKGTQQSGQIANLAGKGIACSAGQILANLITSAVSSGIQSLTKKGVVTAVGQLKNVPVDQSNTKPAQDISDVNDATRLSTNAKSGALDPSGSVLIMPSWDSIAWCIINTIIEYLIDSTIAWANTGFNGNPAFITNPEAFFQGLADQEAGAFIQEVAKGTGINVCQPFRVQISLGLAQAYGNSSGGRRSSCTIQSIVKNYDGFVNGNFNQGGWEGWFAMTQSDPNNRFGAYQIANDEMYARISARNNTANLELGWNKGFLSFKHCADKTDPKNPKDCQTDTPGTLIQSSLEKSLNLPKDRLIVAQKFDQLVTTLVNSLIKVALDKVLTSNSKNGQSTSGGR